MSPLPKSYSRFNASVPCKYYIETLLLQELLPAFDASTLKIAAAFACWLIFVGRAASAFPPGLLQADLLTEATMDAQKKAATIADSLLLGVIGLTHCHCSPHAGHPSYPFKSSEEELHRAYQKARLSAQSS